MNELMKYPTLCDVVAGRDGFISSDTLWKEIVKLNTPYLQQCVAQPNLIGLALVPTFEFMLEDRSQPTILIGVDLINVFRDGTERVVNFVVRYTFNENYFDWTRFPDTDSMNVPKMLSLHLDTGAGKSAATCSKIIYYELDPSYCTDFMHDMFDLHFSILDKATLHYVEVGDIFRLNTEGLFVMIHAWYGEYRKALFSHYAQGGTPKSEAQLIAYLNKQFNSKMERIAKLHVRFTEKLDHPKYKSLNEYYFLQNNFSPVTQGVPKELNLYVRELNGTKLYVSPSMAFQKDAQGNIQIVYDLFNESITEVLERLQKAQNKFLYQVVSNTDLRLVVKHPTTV